MYPSAQLKDNINNISNIIKDEIQFTKQNELSSFLDYLKQNNLSFLQENYVSIFDRQKKYSLYLFEHIHGDSRERGTAIIDLQNLYKNHNFDISEAKELPDYIPLFLEFISIIDEKEAYNMLSEVINLISIIRQRLELINSKYSILFSILESLSKIKPDYLVVEKIINKDKDIDNESNIDKEWEEEKIF
ncbi:MAG TPA: nitrate reductase molybdenum cofactor assembly chaperone [Candidatus Azoamicus sp.]